MIVRAYHAVLTLPIAQLYAAGGPVSKVFAGPRSSYAVCDSSSASLGYTAGAFAWGSREFGSLGDSSVSATHAYEPVRLDAFADEATTGRLAKASSSTMLSRTQAVPCPASRCSRGNRSPYAN